MDNKRKLIQEIRAKENLKKWDFLLSTEEIDIVLYDFKIINPSYDDCTQFESTERFCDCLYKTFKLYFEYEVNSELQQRQAAEVYIKMLFESYYNKIKYKYDKDSSLILKLLKDWCLYTKFLCKEVFVKFIVPCSNSIEIKDYSPLYHEMVSGIDGALASFLRDQESILWSSEPSVVLYNLWGTDFNALCDKVSKASSWLSSEDRECADYVLDETRLLKELKQYYTTIADPNCNNTKMDETGCELVAMLETLFVDYTYRIRVANNYCSSHLSYAVECWGVVTKSLIVQIEEYYEFQIRIAFTPQSAKNIIDDCILPPKAEDAIRRIKNIADKCTGFVSAMCNRYLERIKSGWLEMPWSESLQSMGIDYEGLYSDMKGVYLPDLITFTEFRNAFIYADFSKLHSEAKNNYKSGGCILFLIDRLKGQEIDEDWVNHACMSIYPTKENPYRTLQANADPGQKKGQFEDVLLRNIAVFKKKKRRK